MAVIAGRQTLQHRAIYPGGLQFIGASDGLFSSLYSRTMVWKAPHYTDALPSLTVYIEDKGYALDALTPGLFVSLGGADSEGALYDSRGTMLTYRFEGGRLTAFSLIAEWKTVVRKPGGNVKQGQFSLSRGEEPGVTLPVTSGALRDALGPPERSTLVFAQ